MNSTTTRSAAGTPDTGHRTPDNRISWDIGQPDFPGTSEAPYDHRTRRPASITLRASLYSGRRKPGSHGPNAVREGSWGFKQFLLRGNLIDLAIAVVIGVAFSAIITALVTDLITPLIAAIGGQPDFSALTFKVNTSTFHYGAFVNALLSFVIIAAVIYFLVVLPVTRIMALNAKKAEATEQECPECLSQIPLAARRCMYCTAEIAPAQGTPAA